MKCFFKKSISVFLMVAILIGAAPLSGFVGIDLFGGLGFEAEAANVGIDIGDYITLGSYNGESIRWRCVDIDENGPLMLSDKILCLKSYDAAGDNSEYHTDDWGYIRKERGSNCWSDSSLRQWLNSDELTVKYSHCPPNEKNVYDGLNEYDDEVGFLVNFSVAEQSLIKSVTQKVILNEYDATSRTGYLDGGKRELNYSLSLTRKDYDSYYYQEVTDSIFLLNPSQADAVAINLGVDYLVNAYPTQAAIDNSEYKHEKLSVDEPWDTWLAIPRNEGASFENLTTAGVLGGKFEVSSVQAYASFMGVRPAFYLNMSAAYSNFDTFNVIKDKGPVSDCGISFSVDALDKASTEDNPIYIDANGAEVSIYLGAERIASTNVVNGVASFNKSDFPSKYDIDYIKKKATVSAHLKAENGLELCSEEVKGNGRWDGAKLSKVLSGEISLVADEPRWYVPELRVLINESDEETCKKMLEKYSELFAQATNGHVIVNNFTIVVISDEFIKCRSEVIEHNAKKLDIDICMVRNKDTGAWGSVLVDHHYLSPGDIDSTNGGYGIPDTIIWCPVGNENETKPFDVSARAKTLCHESGHYLFGFLDEYASAIGRYEAAMILDGKADAVYGGNVQTNFENYTKNQSESFKFDIKYDYDANRNGVLEPEEKGAAKWKIYYGNWGDIYERKVGVPRPSYAPNRFGLMEKEEYGIEMSQVSDYDDLNKNSTNYKEYTLQYFALSASCEEKMAHELEQMAGTYGVDYSWAEGEQTASYSYAGGNNVSFTPDNSMVSNAFSLNSVSEGNDQAASELMYDFCAFDYSESELKITAKSSAEVLLKDTLGNILQRVTLDEKNNYTYNFDVQIEPNYLITVEAEVDGVLCSKIYTFSRDDVITGLNLDEQHSTVNLYGDTESEYATVYVCNSGEIINGEYKSISGEYILFTEDDSSVCGNLSTNVAFNLPIDYSTMTWFYKADSEWVALETGMGVAEHGETTATCSYVGDGTYCLMAKEPSDSSYAVPTDVSVTNSNQLYDKDVTVTFADSNENVMYYNVYYGTKPITAQNCGDMSVYVTDSTVANISLDDSKTTYYFAVQVVGNDGGRSELSKCVSSTGALHDSDGDGLPDYWLDMYPVLAELENIPGTDSDDDGLTNIKEYQLGTNPLNPDTDGDNVYDGLESFLSFNPLNPMTDGETDDYIVIYGTPDVFIDVTSFVVDGNTVACTISNNTDGKAMRTEILLYVGEEIVNVSSVNIDADSSVEYSFPKEYLVENMRIVIDESKITRDADYSNNEFVYVPVTSITAETQEVVLVEGATCKLTYRVQPENVPGFVTWTSSDESVAQISADGVLTGIGAGMAQITAVTVNGLECVYYVEIEHDLRGEYEYRFINGNTEVEILNYIGENESVVIPEMIERCPVTSICDGAFYNCNRITSVTIPDSVKSIGEAAFYECYELESVSIGSGLISIGEHAFSGCNKLNFISVSSDNEYYSNDKYGVLFNKDKTKLMRCPEGCEQVNYVIPDSVVAIGGGAFEGCGNLVNITIPDSVSSVGDCAFVACYSLAGFSVDEGNEFYSNDGRGALLNKDKTTLVTYPAGAEGLSYKIPDSVINVGDFAFYCCNNVENVIISDNVTNIGSMAFSNCENLSDVKIGNSVLTIGESAFSGCYKLVNIQISDSVTFIAEYAFSDCGNLTKVIIGDNVTEIGRYAFAECYDITSIAIGDSIADIGKYAFYHCENITDVYYKGSEEQWLNVSVSNNTNLTSATIHYNHVCEYINKCLVEPSVTEEGYKLDECLCGRSDKIIFPAIGFESVETVSVDFVNGVIFGFNVGEISLDGYTSFISDDYEWKYETLNGILGTGSKAIITDGEKTIAEYTVVIFGDIDGNGWYDANDAFLVKMLVAGLLTRELVGEAIYKAADCNHDGVVDELDAQLIEKASILLDNVKQSATQEELATNSFYIEYCSIIDQSAGLDEDFATDEIVSQPSADAQPEAELQFDLALIFNFILSVFERIFMTVFSLIA